MGRGRVGGGGDEQREKVTDAHVNTTKGYTGDLREPFDGARLSTTFLLLPASLRRGRPSSCRPAWVFASAVGRHPSAIGWVMYRPAAIRRVSSRRPYWLKLPNEEETSQITGLRADL